MNGSFDPVVARNLVSRIGLELVKDQATPREASCGALCLEFRHFRETSFKRCFCFRSLNWRVLEAGFVERIR